MEKIEKILNDKYTLWYLSWSTIGNTFHEESLDREISRKSLTDYSGGCNIIIAASEAAIVPIGTIMAVEAGGPMRGREEE